MSRKSRVSRRRMIRQLKSMHEIFEVFDDATLDELDRVSRISSDVDGWPSGGTGSGGSGDANPTLLAVIRRVSQKPIYDHRQASAETVAQNLDEAHQRILHAYRALLVFRAIEDDSRGRETTLAECGCCGSTVTGLGNDRLRANYCHACYAAWHRAKKAGTRDRVRFETDRRAQMVEEAERADEAS